MEEFTGSPRGYVNFLFTSICVLKQRLYTNTTIYSSGFTVFLVLQCFLLSSIEHLIFL
jgi:hypothetical protein